MDPCERFVSDGDPFQQVPDVRQRVHVIPGISNPFCRRLVDRCVRERLEWCHWGERTGIRFAALVHGHPRVLGWTLPLLNSVLRRNYARKINQTSLGVFAIGKLAEDDFVSWGVRRDLIRHLYYSTRTVRSEPRPGEGGSTRRDGSIHFMYLGSIYREKGIGHLLNALNPLSTRTWRLTVVGKDLSHGRYQELAQSLGLGDRVTWVGPVRSTDVGGWLGQADVLVLPSLFDGWGAVLNEGACAGRALVATTQCGAAWHVIEPGVNGLRVLAGDVPALTEAMSRYVEDPGMAERHGEASRELYLREFTAERNAERLALALEEWRARPARRPSVVERDSQAPGE